MRFPLAARRVAALASVTLWGEGEHRPRLRTSCNSEPKAVPSVASPVASATPSASASVGPPSPPSPPPSTSQGGAQTGQEGEDGEEQDEWDIEKEKCSFCKAFLKSPCRLPFKRWSLCVDKAKEEDKDFVQACSDHTNALLECTSEHSSFFQVLQEEEGAGDGEGDEEGAEEGEGEVLAEVEKKDDQGS